MLVLNPLKNKGGEASQGMSSFPCLLQGFWEELHVQVSCPSLEGRVSLKVMGVGRVGSINLVLV